MLYRAADLVVDGYERVIERSTRTSTRSRCRFSATSKVTTSSASTSSSGRSASFRRAVVPLSSPLERLSNGTVAGIHRASAPLFRECSRPRAEAAEAIEGHDRLLTDVLQADLARLGMRQSEIAVRQNEDMRKISAWAAIALLPTAVAGIYGMNFEHMPELGWRYGYFVVLVVIAAACLALYRVFRRYGWL